MLRWRCDKISRDSLPDCFRCNHCGVWLILGILQAVNIPGAHSSQVETLRDVVLDSKRSSVIKPDLQLYPLNPETVIASSKFNHTSLGYFDRINVIFCNKTYICLGDRIDTLAKIKTLLSLHRSQHGSMWAVILSRPKYRLGNLEKCLFLLSKKTKFWIKVSKKHYIQFCEQKPVKLLDVWSSFSSYTWTSVGYILEALQPQ